MKDRIEEIKTLKRRLLRVAAAACIGALSAGTAQAMVQTGPVSIGLVQIYTDYDNGDVSFTISTAVTGCDGFWLNPADGGYKQVLSQLLTAKAAGQQVVIYAYDTILWPGSTGNYCKVRSITTQ